MREFCKASAGVILMLSGAIQFAAGAETGAATPKKAAPPRPVFSWTGFYLGGNVGGGTSRINFSGTGVFTIAGVADPFAFADSGTASEILAGGQLGFNYELPTHVVLGFEADLDGSSFHGLTTFCSTGTGGPLLGHGANCETSNNKLEQFSTVRGRVGYAFDKVLVYGTGGFAGKKFHIDDCHLCHRCRLLPRSWRDIHGRLFRGICHARRLGGGSRYRVGAHPAVDTSRRIFAPGV